MNILLKAASVTDKGLNPQYTVNEDSYLILESNGVFAVADGVGGANAGDVASQTVLRTISKAIRNTQNHSDASNLNPLDFVKSLIETGNKAVYHLSKERQQQIATTIALMLINQNEAILGHVGDSRIYIQRDGKLVQLTKDHSKLQDLLDNRLLTEKEQKEFQERHVITKAVGAEATVEPDIQKVILKKDDLFVLCTDGVYIHNSNKELSEIIKNNQYKLDKICETLKQNCYDKGAKDNLTAVVVKIADKSNDDIDTKAMKVPQDLINTIVKK